MSWPLMGVLLMTTLLGWSCHSDQLASSLPEMQNQYQQWTQTVGNYEKDLAQAALEHQKFMQPYRDTLPSGERQKYLQDSLFRVELGKLETDYRTWSSRQTIATRNLQIFLQSHAQWLSQVSEGTYSPEKALRNWKSRSADFVHLEKDCDAIQLQYPPLAARYAKVGEKPTLPANVR